MDFVVAGLGFGALVVVIGFAVRDLGPHLWRPAGFMSPATKQAERMRWNARCQAVGTYSSVAGGVILLVTVIAVALGLSDGMGAALVGVTAALALATTALLYVQRVMRAELGDVANPVPVMTVSTLASERPETVSSVRRVRRPAATVDAPVAADLPAEAGPAVEPAVPLLPDLPGETPVEREPVGPALAASRPEPDDVPAPPPAAEEAAPVEAGEPGPDEPAAAPVVPAPVEQPLFTSPLLADIGRETSVPNMSGGFTSRVLADVAVGRRVEGRAERRDSDESTPAEPAPAGPAVVVQSEPEAQGEEPPAAAEAVTDDREPSGEDTLIDSRPARIP